ncbi:MAG: aminoacyl-tRNA hydrolase [Rhodospirillales bacterium]|jgi:peptidyl-tRNA hydrolase, PTH1 family|nr:aminoacyl-tRNA hydrolase [Rhodospirillales bacterium]MBT4039907.1 aminoacyl-tRNA hydrolase [Rhodospirillales bacterium]MBT4625688.1 aminoacyl-tRNA hydrolase [Rhodospirillales bacterium]MBT5352354.1 aminoacyl-tRNA hydrolase [Rhodospirillales bacterium]MBT5519800.1 aminoacyl-tRNA hydrolase [Rhodospirillales bacterium]
MHMLVGLGNPGTEYARNRHNIGFMAVDEIVRRHSFAAWRSKFHGDISEGRLGGEKVLVMKPTTFMNESGRAVQAAMTFYKILPQDVVVLHDELDLAGGKLRVKRGGGHAGHNGLRSIHSHIGEGYGRVRIGIGHPGDKSRVVGHVLKDFSKEEDIWVQKLIDGMADNAGLLVEGDDGLFQTRVAAHMAPPKENKDKARNKESE